MGQPAYLEKYFRYIFEANETIGMAPNSCFRQGLFANLTDNELAGNTLKASTKNNDSLTSLSYRFLPAAAPALALAIASRSNIQISKYADKDLQ